MFVLRRKDNNRVFRLGEGVSVAFACRNMLAAKKAVAVVKEQYGVDCVPYKIEQPEMSKYWFLAYRNNHRIGPERGIYVLCGTVRHMVVRKGIITITEKKHEWEAEDHEDS